MAANFFSREDIDLLPPNLSVWVNASPPRTDFVTNETYKHWPATHFSSALSTLLDSEYSEPGHQRYGFVWANRRNQGPDGFNYKPNDAPGIRITDDGTEEGKECRGTFSTIALANAATRIQIRHMLGLDWRAIQSNNPALRVLTYNDWNLSELDRRAEIFTRDMPYEQAGVTTTWRVCKDTVLLPPFSPALRDKMDGVEIDYEPQDGRSPGQTAAFLELIRHDIQDLAKKKAYLVVNPYTASGAAKGGITPGVLATVFQQWDYLSVWLHSNSDEGSIPDLYDAQIALLPPLINAAQWKRLVIRFELGLDPDAPDPGTTLDDATWLHTLLTGTGALHPTAVYFHRNGAVPGGPSTTYTNQKIARVCFGT